MPGRIGARMLIMTWNLGHGGIDPDTGSDDRFWQQIDLIRQIQPDILCLQEAHGWHEQGYAQLLVFEHATGLRSFIALAPSGMHTVIAIKPATVRPLKHTPLQGMQQHACNTLTVEFSGYQLPVTVVSAHFTERDGDTRLQEAAHLIHLAQKPAVITGNLNCSGAEDRPADLTNIEASHLCGYSLLPIPTQDGVIDLHQPSTEDRRAVYRLMQAGFTDTVTARTDLAMPPPDTASYGATYQRRHDHILTSPLLVRLLVPDSYTVFDTEQTRSVSNHLPVLVEIGTT
jgi:endonuclease/exonuclease/phosphatase family metal-dependent hydrolase